MKSCTAILAAAATLISALSAQETTKLEFEAASVKLSGHADPSRGVGPAGRGTFYSYNGCSGGPATTDPVRFICVNVNLRDLIEQAWSLRSFQLVGPAGIESPTYDIEAKVPLNTTEDQFKQMLQNLLIERFRMATHHEQREQPVYVLSMGKDGHRLQAPAPDDKESPMDALNNNSNGDGKTKGLVNGMPPEEAARFNELRARLAEMKKASGRASRTGDPPPSHIASRTSNGNSKLAGRRATMADLTRWISNHFNCPVLDHTGLAGEWNFIAEFDSRDTPGGRGSPAAEAMASMRERLGNPPPAANLSQPSTPSGLPSISTAFQKQLGLKLETAKAPGDVLVIDKVDKTPAAN